MIIYASIPEAVLFIVIIADSAGNMRILAKTVICVFSINYYLCAVNKFISSMKKEQLSSLITPKVLVLLKTKNQTMSILSMPAGLSIRFVTMMLLPSTSKMAGRVPMP